MNQPTPPICIDLFCGLGGWTEGFLAEGYRCIGFDIERHDYGTGGYPGELVLQDALTLDGRQFRNAACIVASPPCQRYSYMAMPFSRGKKLAAWYRDPAHPERIEELNALFNACFRVQREACEAAGRHIPLVVENVVGAQRWVGSANWHFGAYYLWGDVPALMPTTLRLFKSPGRNFHVHELTNGEISSPSFDGAAHESRGVGLGTKTVAHVNIRNGHTHTRHLTNTRESERYREGLKHGGDCFSDPSWPGKQGGTKQRGSGAEWFDNGIAKHSSRSNSRKAASAQIAKIPFELSNWIARCFKPEPRRDPRRREPHNTY